MDQEETKAIMNIGDLAQPATKLVEKISDAIGVMFEPTRLIRAAHAEVEVEKIRAAGRIAISDIEQRGLIRMVREQGRIQENIESVTEGAIPLLNAGSDPSTMKEDWVAHFFDKCKLISDPEMQSLWSAILAGEANASGTYSKKTIDIVSVLEQKDAELFTQLCRFVWDIGGREPMILGSTDPIYEGTGLTFQSLNHLASLGLITYNSSGLSKRHPSEHEDMVISYFGAHIVMRTERKNNLITCGNVIFTQAGHEFSKICRALPVKGFIEFMVYKFLLDGFVTLSFYPRSDI